MFFRVRLSLLVRMSEVRALPLQLCRAAVARSDWVEFHYTTTSGSRRSGHPPLGRRPPAAAAAAPPCVQSTGRRRSAVRSQHSSRGRRTPLSGQSGHHPRLQTPRHCSLRENFMTPKIPPFSSYFIFWFNNHSQSQFSQMKWHLFH